MYDSNYSVFQPLFMLKRKEELHIDIQSCGGKTRIVARNSRIAGGGGEAVGRQ